MHMKKCITIHLLLVNVRPRFTYRKMQILWSFTLLWNCWGACSPPIHPNVLRNDRRSLHVLPTTWHASQTKRQKKYGWGRGAPLIELPPQQLYSHHTADLCAPQQAYDESQEYFTFTKINLTTFPGHSYDPSILVLFLLWRKQFFIIFEVENLLEPSPDCIIKTTYLLLKFRG